MHVFVIGYITEKWILLILRTVLIPDIHVVGRLKEKKEYTENEYNYIMANQMDDKDKN